MSQHLLVITQPEDLHLTDSNAEVLCVGVAPIIHVRGTSRIFTSFIGSTPATVIVHGTEAKVWEVKRCGAVYHHHGRCEDINPQNSALFFCDFYSVPTEDGVSELRRRVQLLKRVNEQFHDYYSGKYDYSPGKTVTAADWVPIDRIVCGNALHLCATIPQSKQWNEGGRLVRCSVALKDLCVFPYNISQVRCRQVDVIEEVMET